ncbi:MAG: hypothetical protein HMLKMBBP_00366 [Planctomycetes bacterium]|nr:hypothetical protein [Planctomycetota bacterium]
MARRRKRRAGAPGAAGRVGRAITDVAAIPKRIDDRVRPFAQAAGWAGIAALAACLALRGASADAWPFGLGPSDFPVCVTVSLVAASLLGWSFMQEGQARIERAVGRGASLALFVFAPLAAAAAGWIEHRSELPDETRRAWSAAFAAARWYAPAVVAAGLVAFFVRGTRVRALRTAWRATLALPYAALLAALVFGVRLPWVGDELRAALGETLGSLGTGAVALQIVLAWFVGGTG